MTPKRPAIVPVEVWEQALEPVQVVISAMVEYYEQRIAGLEARSAGVNRPPQSEFAEFLEAAVE